MVVQTEEPRIPHATRADSGWDCLGTPLGAAVKARRVELGLTQERLAAQAGMSQGALSRLERGRAVPTLPLLERLASAMSANLLIALSPTGTVQVAFRVPGARTRRALPVRRLAGVR
ncbi:helix-turn-helix domain-containing protein [Streptomyces acidiscabies]|uniref:helix-turn-helix domain-containing protein n=1 Tax=Streptomyces acidiscabies TaxID=42234 RepID=UPI0038F6B67B